jgi:hypothetical protein
LYQRRWRAYWITSALASSWFVGGAMLGQNTDSATEAQNQLVGLIGLLALAQGLLEVILRASPPLASSPAA